MPLLVSPIDGSPMHQIRRFGIELDVCPTSGGVWLDKGELEKIMALIREETSAQQPSHPAQTRRRDDEDRYRDHDDDDDDRRRGYRRSRLLDLFDFD